MSGTKAESERVIEDLRGLGIEIDEVTQQLEEEGIRKFESSWTELLETVSDGLARAAGNDAAEEAGR